MENGACIFTTFYRIHWYHKLIVIHCRHCFISKVEFSLNSKFSDILAYLFCCCCWFFFNALFCEDALMYLPILIVVYSTCTLNVHMYAYVNRYTRAHTQKILSTCFSWNDKAKWRSFQKDFRSLGKVALCNDKHLALVFVFWNGTFVTMTHSDLISVIWMLQNGSCHFYYVTVENRMFIHAHGHYTANSNAIYILTILILNFS